MKQLLAYLGDIGYKWADGESLYDTNTANVIWTERDGEELFVIIEGNAVCYEDDKDDIKKLYGEYRIMDYDNIQELKEDYSVEFSLNKREYVIDVPDILRLDGYPEPPVLTRNGDTYLLECGIIYGDSHLFTKIEAERALKELNINWEITKVK